MSLIVYCKDHGNLYDTHQHIGDVVDLSKWEALSWVPVPSSSSDAWRCTVPGCRRSIAYDYIKLWPQALEVAVAKVFA